MRAQGSQQGAECGTPQLRTDVAACGEELAVAPPMPCLTWAAVWLDADGRPVVDAQGRPLGLRAPVARLYPIDFQGHPGPDWVRVRPLTYTGMGPDNPNVFCRRDDPLLHLAEVLE